MQVHVENIFNLVENAENIVILTGAGVSTGSGIPDFKSLDATVAKQNLSREIILNINYFKREPEDFWVKYMELFDLDMLAKAEPSAVHTWIAKLEEKKKVTVITQNIDGLHTKSGSSHVIELHGNAREFICIRCGEVYTRGEVNKQLEYVEAAETYQLRYEAPKCLCEYPLKPNVVLFGEQINGFEEASAAVKAADLFIVLGTRLQVSPANTLVDKFLKQQKKAKYKGESRKPFVVWTNDVTPYDTFADLKIQDAFELHFKEND